jgi:hypothetical protein
MLNEKTLNNLVEQRITQMQNEQDRLVETWNVFVNAADEYTKKEENRELNVHERRNIAQCLENAFIEGGLKSRRKLFEATTEDSISFLGIPRLCAA